MKKTLYWILGLFLFCGWADLVWSQEIQKGGKKPTSCAKNQFDDPN